MTKLPKYVVRRVSARALLLSALIIVIASAVQYALWPALQPLAYLVYYPAVVICAFYGDGLAATVMSILVAEYVFVPPEWALTVAAGDLPRLLTFAFAGVMITALVNELKSDRNRLVAERQLRQQLISMIAHDLRNPLTAARLGIDRTLYSWPPASQAALLRSLEAITRADKLVANILDVSRAAAGQPMPLSKSPTELKAIAQAALQDAELTFGNRFRLDAPGEPVVAEVDAEGIRRVVDNLLGNAGKYGDPNTPISVRLRREGDSVKFAVVNQGEPMSADALAGLFQPFFRGGRSEGGGWGLGLAAVKGIVEAHGGAVRAESSRERGTVFEVSLPGLS